MNSYSTNNIKHYRNIIIMMSVFPVAIIILVAATFFMANKSTRTDAQAVCTKTIASGSVATNANSMQAGQTLCLQGTANFSGGTINRGVKITTVPGQSSKAKVVGFLGLAGSGITMDNLYINANGDVRSPFITGDNVTLSNNEIVNIGTTRGICILIGPSDGSIKPRNTVIDRNRIHDCGKVIHDQGIYMAHSIDARVTNNYIYDNPDFGIQFYPSAQGSIVENNVFDNNGQGITFSSESGFPIKSNNNIVRNNIITNSFRRYNVEYYWGGGQGTGNQFVNNCVFNGAQGNIQGPVGFSVSGTIVADPLYNNRAAKDFSLKPGSPCAGKGPQTSVVAPAPAPSPLPPTAPPPSPAPAPSPNTPPPPSSPTIPSVPISVPGANTSTPVAIPAGLPAEEDGSLVADFNGDGVNEIARDSNGDGFIDPTNEIVAEGADDESLIDKSSSPVNISDIKKNSETNSFTINAGPILNVKIAKPVVYTFAIAQGVLITGLGAYLAVTKLAIFAGFRNRIGL